MLFTVYNTLATIGVALYSPFILFKKGLKHDRRRFISERFGLSDYQKTDIWVHGVSVGEVLAALPFLKALRKEYPSKKITLSTTTHTGQYIAITRFKEADRIMYMPVDPSLFSSRVVKRLRPDIFITIETELWPSLFRELRESGSRLVLLNGRISRASFRGYNKIRPFMRHVLRQVDYFYMQTRDDAERIISLGAPPERVGVMGNFKFDIHLEESKIPEWPNAIKGDILLAASTHEGEEEKILDAYECIKREIHDLNLILAPRHPERFNDVAALLRSRGFDFTRRSSLNGSPGSVSGIILLDTIGELPYVFACVTIAFIGGSLIPHGGHNILEPAYWAKPIIFGPYMDNFPFARDFLKRNAACEVQNPEDLAQCVIELLTNRTRLSQMGRNARAIIEENRGAVSRAIDLIRRIYGNT